MTTLTTRLSQATEPTREKPFAYCCAEAGVGSAATSEALNTFADSKAVKLAELQEKRPELHRGCVEALDARRSALSQEGHAVEDTGEGFTTDPQWEE